MTSDNDEVANTEVANTEGANKEVDKISNHSKDVNTEESQSEHIPYPKSVFFIISNEFCERFSYYGMRTILSLYLRDILLYSEGDSTVIYHLFSMFAYFFPLLGAIMADSWLGKFKTIFYVSIIYAVGNILLSLAATSPLHLPQVSFSLISLLLIAIGTGGIKPCVSSFGGDQFVLPQQATQLASFFSVFYFMINAGSLISTFITPILRKDVHCFGEDSCYPLAFGVPGVLMIISLVIFLMGSKMYKEEKNEGNVVVKVVKCVWYALRNKSKSKDKEQHWLDRSEEKFGKTLVYDVKLVMKVLIVFAPLPIFWMLYDQQGSAWTFQAARMNGNVGSYTILPDQFQVINPVLILGFIPLFNYWVYPAFAKCNLLKNPLQRMVVGGFLAALAFGISAGVSFALEATFPVYPTSGNSQLRFYNPLSCKGVLTAPDFELTGNVTEMGYTYFSVNDVHGHKNGTFEFTPDVATATCLKQTGTLRLIEKQTLFYYLSTKTIDETFEDDIAKPDDGIPLVRTLTNVAKDIELDYSGGLSIHSSNQTLYSINPGTYKVNKFDKDLEFKLGGVYTVLIEIDDNDVIQHVSMFEITQPNSVHIFWLLPQYFIITVAEILISITGIEFSYSEAPNSMKSVISAVYLLTDAFGNLFIVIIESIGIFDRQSHDFLLYTALMVVDMLCFMYIAIRYKYRTEEEKENARQMIDD